MFVILRNGGRDKLRYIFFGGECWWINFWEEGFGRLFFGVTKKMETGENL